MPRTFRAEVAVIMHHVSMVPRESPEAEILEPFMMVVLRDLSAPQFCAARCAFVTGFGERESPEAAERRHRKIWEQVSF
jgi:hypothetical protein